MAFLLILIGLVLIVTAYRSTMGDLATALETDLPGFFLWGLAIFAILALGYIPGMKTPSRGLLLLVALVIVLTQWNAISQGLQNFRSAAASAPSGTPTPTPTEGYATSGGPAAPPTQAEITGTSGASSSTATATATGAAVAGASALPGGALLSPAAALAGFNPGAFLQSFSQSIGFGGLAS